jgi:hypothetical protein
MIATFDRPSDRNTDAEREVAYDRKSSIGRLDRRSMRGRRDWVVVEMKEDWKKVFPFQ